jgi:hypothetical protein
MGPVAGLTVSLGIGLVGIFELGRESFVTGKATLSKTFLQQSFCL